MKVLLFEDERIATLAPVVVGRPAFSVSCGGWRLVDLLTELDQPLAADVRPHLRATALADYAVLDALESIDAAMLARDEGAWPLLLVNARTAPSMELLRTLESLVADPRPALYRNGDSISVASLLAPPAADASLLASQKALSSTSGEPNHSRAANLETWLAVAAPPLVGELPMFHYPHDIVRHHLTTFAANLDYFISRSSVRETSPGLFLAPSAKFGQHVVTDTSRGPIVIAEGAEVGPFALLTGPALLGPRARVNPHAAIREFVALGHTTKIGGEIEASIIEPYTNKQHHGFIGHSYLGSWVNLGAGTCNSDLKNTYGQVNVEYLGRKVPTGMQFVGATIGDYAKTAINTGIFTGKTIGVCSMVYGFVTTNVPSFVNYARLFGQVTEAPVEVMVATQKRMFSRRGVEQRPSDIQLLHDMYALTAAERRLSGETLSIEPLSL